MHEAVQEAVERVSKAILQSNPYNVGRVLPGRMRVHNCGDPTARSLTLGPLSTTPW